MMRRVLPRAAAKIETMLEGSRRSLRKKAAKEILAAGEDKVPRYAWLGAKIENNRKCSDKDEYVVKAQELGDSRVAPVLHRLRKAPKDGCGGVFNKHDCFGCLRTNLIRALDVIDPGYEEREAEEKKKKKAARKKK